MAVKTLQLATQEEQIFCRVTEQNQSSFPPAKAPSFGLQSLHHPSQNWYLFFIPPYAEGQLR